MATFYLQDRDAEGLAGPGAFSNTLSPNLAGPVGSRTVSVPNGTTNSCLGITNRNVPSNALWEAGTMTVKVRVTTANANIALMIQAVRFNSSGVAQQNTGNSAEQALSAAGVYTFTVPTLTWTAGNCDDRLGLWYYFRSTQAHGAQASVVIEVGGSDESVVTSITRSTGTCYSLFIEDHAQFRDDHVTAIAEGGISAGDGVSNNLYLDTRVAAYEWRENADLITAKVEAEQVGTAFDDVANFTNTKTVQLNPDSPEIRRSTAVAYDSSRKRMLLCGGWDGTTQYNDLWELSLDSLFSPQPQWKKLAPTGTPMSARRTHVMEYDATNDRLIVGFGYDGADKGDIFAISFSGGADGAWSTLSPSGTAPAARAQASSAIKNSTGTFYLVCGWGAARYNTVHALDLTPGSEAWSVINDGTGTAPSTRNDPGVIFDVTNNRLVLFGGYDGTNRLNDLWQLNLSTNAYSTLSATGTAPSTRELMCAEYDPVNERMIVAYGRNGTAASDVRNDWFQLDLTTPAWTDLTGAAGERPAGVWGAGSCYDPDHQIMIVSCGMDSSLYETRHNIAFDLSTADAGQVYQVYANNGLQGRDAMGYAYNPDRRETLFVGGYARQHTADIFDGEHTTEMWIFDHANEQYYNPLRNAILGMPNREGATAVYDTNRNRFIIFGGLTGNNTANNTFYNDVWSLTYDANVNGYVLAKLNPTGTKPSARWLQASVYDQANDRMVMFGGDDGASFKNDLWQLSFSGSADGAWSTLTATGTAPSAKRQPTYIYDATNVRMVIACGGTGVNTFTNEVHTLSLTSGSEAWTSRATGPSARRGMTGCYASDKEYMLCFGGFNGTVVNAETWYLNLSTFAWTQLTPATTPPARRSHTAGYDVTSKKMFIFGGRDAADLSSSFITRNNTYIIDTTNATPSNWDWAFAIPKMFVNLSVKLTGLVGTSDYHWQAWATGVEQKDAQKQSAFANAESAADFKTNTSSGTAYTQDLTETAVITPALASSLTFNRSLSETVQVAGSLANALVYQKALSETLVLTDDMTFAMQRTFTEALQIADSIATAITQARAFVENITVSGTIATAITFLLQLLENVTTSDALAKTKTVLRTFVENLTIADTRTMATQLTLTDPVQTSDTIVNQSTFLIALSETIQVADTAAKAVVISLQETIQLSDTLASAAQATLDLTETIQTADSIAAAAAFLLSLTETVQLSDTIASTTSRVLNLVETVRLTTSLALTNTLLRTFTEAVQIGETFTQAVNRLLGLTETITVADTFAGLRTFLRSLTETVQVTDTTTRSTAKLLNETLQVADTLATQASATLDLAETIRVTDTIARLTTRSLTETIAASDTVALLKTYTRAFTENVTVAQTLATQIVKNLLETIAASDTLANAKTYLRTLAETVTVAGTLAFATTRTFTESLQVAGTFATQAAATLGLTETIQVTDTIGRSIARSFTETITLVQSIAQAMAKSFTETVQTSDTVTTSQALTLALTETIRVADIVSRLATKSFQEAIQTSDTVQFVRTLLRSFAENVSVAGAVQFATSKAFQETLQIADTLANQVVATLGLAETLRTTDTLAKSVTVLLTETLSLASTFASTGTILKSFTESVTVAGTLASTFAKTFTETIQASATLANVNTLLRSFAETITNTDAITFQTSRTFTETVQVADTIANTIAKLLNLTETITAADQVAFAAAKSFQEAVQVADTLAIVKILQRAFTETIAVAGTFLTGSNLGLNETLQAADTLSNLKTYTRAFTETLQAADTIVRQMSRSLQEQLTVAGNLSRSIVRSFTETITTSDTIANAATKVLSLAEALQVSDVIDRAIQKTFQETVTIAATLTNLTGNQLNLAETITVADTVAKGAIKSLTEAISTADSLLFGRELSVSENLSVNDTILVSASKLFTEAIVASESIGFIASKVFTEALALTQSFQASGSSALNLQETIRTSDAIARQVGLAFEEAITVADSLLNTVISKMRAGFVLLTTRGEDSQRSVLQSKQTDTATLNSTGEQVTLRTKNNDK